MRLEALFRRQRDVAWGRCFEAEVSQERLGRLEFSASKSIKSAHKGGITWMDLDPVEQRYLLAGAADASLAAYDTQQPSTSTAGGGEHRALFTITKQAPGAHSFSVSSVCWYPVDSGLFVSGGFDCQVKVWDANALVVVCDFSLPARVYAVAMSPVAASHCLVAAGSGDAQVTLCDMASGGGTHTLSGHRAGVWAVAWSPVSEWELVTGSCDGQLRLWDIRRSSGAVHVFDQHQTARRPSAAASAHPAGSEAAQQQHQQRQREKQRSALYATAHDGAVTGVAPTPDGLFWLTAGTDNHLRMWDTSSRANRLVHYPNAYNRAAKARQLAVSGDGRAVFHPSGSAVQVFDAHSGRQLAVLSGGHFESINCCRWSPREEELYSGANDCAISVWAPRRGGTAGAAAAEEEGGAGSDRDEWSD